ncbi:hypothetical protein BDF22DRAFT_745779 [Syncephalis plumigaleata]|nr:hypothetical protein BDF22DRAFT_745779 [Syncephalis plumigaleata]
MSTKESKGTALKVLPGSQRQVHTSLYEFARSRRQWRSIREECFTHLTTLSNIALQLGIWHPALLPFHELKNHYRTKQQALLLAKKEKVDILFGKLTRQHERMIEQIQLLQQLQVDLTARLVERLNSVAVQHESQLALDQQLIEQLAKVQSLLAIQQTTAMPTSIINGTPMVNRIAKDLAVKSEEKQLKVDTPADVSKVAVQPVNTKPQVIPSATILPSTTTTTKEAAPTSTPL